MKTWMVRIWRGSEMETPGRNLSPTEAMRCALYHLGPAALFGERADAALLADTASSRTYYMEADKTT